MQRLLMAVVLSTSCLAISACQPKRIVTALPIPPERMDCKAAGARPTIPPEATGSHDAFVKSVRAREGVIASYIIEIEGKLFDCASDAQWLREWQAATK